MRTSTARTIILLSLLTASTAIAGAASGECESITNTEANVCGVDWNPIGDEIQFWVTIYDTNNISTGNADWWQIETPDGTLLARQQITQPNMTDSFTSNATFSIPDGIDEVIVRAHDVEYGYGGRVAVVGFLGTQQLVDQGAEPNDFSYLTASDSPQTDGGSESSGDSGEDASSGGAGGFGAGNGTNEDGETSVDGQTDQDGPDATGDGPVEQLEDDIGDIFDRLRITPVLPAPARDEPLYLILSVVFALVLLVEYRYHRVLAAQS